MDMLVVLSSVSKLAFIAFGITLIVVVFEAYLLLKNRVQTDSISVPEFKGDALKAQTLDIKTAGVYAQERQKSQEDRRKRVRLVSYLVSLAVLLGVTIIGVELVVRSQREKVVQQESSPVVLPTRTPTSVEEPVSFEEFGVGEGVSPTSTPLRPTDSEGQAPTTTGSPTPAGGSLTLTPTPTSIIIAKSGVSATVTPTISSTQKSTQLPVSGFALGSLMAVGVFMLFVSLAFVL